eukprot:TRINITY_DN6904_c0_g1_i2.p1 TRINITY_DN6904_c0_g1~~TRINITY_DN6904_c0_g1_i2.p1  ORF type:complete len:1057 (-),score=205.47 TRINITY_DN6904_c0_g1_i2:1190-4360(-)
MSGLEGTRLWIADPEQSFVEAEVLRQQGDGSLVVRNLATGNELVMKSFQDLHFSNPDVEGGYDDMTNLNHLHEAAILHNLLSRFRSDIVYTYSGRTCISVNPFKWLNLYDDDMIAKYQNADFGRLPPHVFAMAEMAYRDMKKTLKSQSILVSGESGAGKTEATKLLLKYIATVAHGDGAVSITEQVLQSNPLLESFGNSKTLRNDNSSRFGKFIELQFDNQGIIIGAKTRTYLLEKSRVVYVSKGERNYHIFYQLLAGADAKMRQDLQLLSGPQDYLYLNQSPCFDLPGVSDAQDFAITLKSMRTVGITEDEINSVLRVLSSILHLGQLKFVVKRRQEDSASLENEDQVEVISQLLSVPKEKLVEALCFRRISTRSETYSKPNNLEQALGARDALAKHLYGRLFDWIVDRINRTTRRDAECVRFIGILDIFGFECFDKNSFEQLCINYANEKLQQQYTRDVFKTVQEEYEAEKIPWSHVDFIDNQECLDLIESKVGLLALLNEECILPKGAEMNLLNKLKTMHESHKNFSKPKKILNGFIINHYAGDVCYEVDNFLEKNKDTLVPDLVVAVKQSTNTFISQLITFTNSAASPAEGTNRIGSRDNFIASQFKFQLNSLMETIMKTSVNYVRCIKPNTSNKPNIFQNIYAAHQLRYAGVLEAIRISRSAYPNRLSYSEFLERFKILAHRSKWPMMEKDPRRAISDLLESCLEEEGGFTIGLTRVYFRYGCLESLEHLRNQQVARVVLFLQKHIRGWIVRRKFNKIRRSARLIQTQWRRFHKRALYLRMRSAVIVVQSFCRMLAAKRLALSTKQFRAALRIQKTYRGYKARVQYKRLKKATILLQSLVRMRHSRKAFLVELNEAREAKKIVNQLALMQQRLQMELAAKAALEEERSRLRQILTTKPEKVQKPKRTPKPKPAPATEPSPQEPLGPSIVVEEAEEVQEIEEIEYVECEDETEVTDSEEMDTSNEFPQQPEERLGEGFLHDAGDLLNQMKNQVPHQSLPTSPLAQDHILTLLSPSLVDSTKSWSKKQNCEKDSRSTTGRLKKDSNMKKSKAN